MSSIQASLLLMFGFQNALDATDVGSDSQANRSVPVLIMEWEDVSAAH